VSAELRARAQRLDAADLLAPARDLFALPDNVTYLDGNSLGALPRSVPARVEDLLRRQWGEGLISSWTAPGGWWDAPQRVGDRIGALVGAGPGQIVVADSTSTNLFKVLVAAVRAAAPRGELLVDSRTFPTDGYVAGSVGRLTGASVRAVDLDRLADELSDRSGAVLLNHVDYRSGRLHDMAALTGQVHQAGALAVWDLSHSVGVVPVELDRHRVDLAVGATYKFLNGGPGSPAFIYVPRSAQAGFDQPLTGWSGHAEPFAMAAEFTPARGVARARTGTPEIVSLLTLDAALDVWDGVRLEDVRAKGLRLTGYFMDCVDALTDPSSVVVVTPRTADRGHQVSLEVADAPALAAALAARGVLVDHRPPSLLRFGFAPLYVRYADALRAALSLRDLLAPRPP
jgi:kynureninase